MSSLPIKLNKGKWREEKSSGILWVAWIKLRDTHTYIHGGVDFLFFFNYLKPGLTRASSSCLCLFVSHTKTDERRKSRAFLSLYYWNRAALFYVTSQRGVSPIMHSWCGSLYLSVTLWHDCDNRLGVTTKSNIEKKKWIVCIVLVIFVLKLGKCFNAHPLLFLILCQVFWWFYFWLKSILLLEHHSIVCLTLYALILSIKHFQKTKKKRTLNNTINKAKGEFNSNSCVVCILVCLEIIPAKV